jgi:hypothetical protein
MFLHSQFPAQLPHSETLPHSQIVKSFVSVAPLITAGEILTGIASSVGAIMRFKQHHDNPTLLGGDSANDGVHIPTELLPENPPPTPPEVSQPPGLDHMSTSGLENNHIPDWFVV